MDQETDGLAENKSYNINYEICVNRMLIITDSNTGRY
jgi:hypothetical protein